MYLAIIPEKQRTASSTLDLHYNLFLECEALMIDLETSIIRSNAQCHDGRLVLAASVSQE